MENTCGRAHWVCGIELNSGSGAAHGQRVVSRPNSQGFLANRWRLIEGLEMFLGVVVTGPGNLYILVHHLLAAPLEPQRQALLQNREIDTHQRSDCTQPHGVLDQPVPAAISQIADRQAAEIRAFVFSSRVDGIAVIDDAGAWAHQTLVTVHGVLIQAHEQVQLIPVVLDFGIAYTHG